jgi:demethylmenaquinone methyltransferase / 2-methoxy-6-polyprenyl-1,4-benzoquinol methylase
VSVLPATEEKAAFVGAMFGRIARTYDRTNRVMTFGLDQQWRQHVVACAAPTTSGYALDVGSGTGDFLPLLAAWMPGGVAVGVDFCLPMMREGMNKLGAGGGVAFVGGDAHQLPFADSTFDAITTGFTLRNVTDIDGALREMWRVARVGGAMVCLEVAQPRHTLVRLAHRAYVARVMPWIGALLSGNHTAYRYLHQSSQAFLAPDELAARMRGAGWQHVAYHLLSLGAVAVHRGVKL